MSQFGACSARISGERQTDTQTTTVTRYIIIYLIGSNMIFSSTEIVGLPLLYIVILEHWVLEAGCFLAIGHHCLLHSSL